MSFRSRTLRYAAVLVSMGLIAPACSGSAAEDTSPVVRGSGTIPATVPRDFPVPTGGVVGDTLIDRVNHRTEFTLELDSNVVGVAQFFDLELVATGYVVTDSRSTPDGSWQIEFTKGEVSGEVTITSTGASTSQAVVTMNVS